MENQSRRDLPERLLAAAVRALPHARREWGAAMMAELAQLQQPSERWRFALSCGTVPISPANPKVAAILGVVLSLPLVSFLTIAYFGIQPLEGYLRAWFAEPDGMRQRISGLVAILTAFLLLPVGAAVALKPVVRSFRSGLGISANPVNLSLGVAIMAGFLLLLTGFVADQLPCWRGVPNCD